MCTFRFFFFFKEEFNVRHEKRTIRQIYAKNKQALNAKLNRDSPDLRALRKSQLSALYMCAHRAPVYMP